MKFVFAFLLFVVVLGSAPLTPCVQRVTVVSKMETEMPFHHRILLFLFFYFFHLSHHLSFIFLRHPEIEP